MGAKDSKTPALTRIVQPSTVTLEDLADPDHPVNQTGMSGKSAGMGLLIGDSLYYATGSSPTATWKQLPSSEESVGFPRGWAVYNDLEHLTIPQVVSEGTNQTIDNDEGIIIEDYLPSDGRLYDGVRINPNTLGSTILIRVTLTVASSKPNGAFSVFVDISEEGDGSFEVARHTVRLVKDSDTFTKQTLDFHLYGSQTFLDNGARLAIEADDGNISVKEIGYYIVK